MQQPSLLRNPRFLVLWISQVVSSFGTPFTALAASWMVYDLTGSKLALSGVLLAHTLPLIGIRLFAGALVDRWDRRRVLVWTELLRGIAVGVVVVTAATGNMALWHLYALNIVLGSAQAFFEPAAFAALPSVVGSEKLVQANSLLNTTVVIASMFGPALAGVAVSWGGAPLAMGVDAVSFLLATVGLMLLPSLTVTQAPKRQSLLRDLTEGFAFFKENRSLAWLTSFAGLVNFCMGLVLTLALPFVRDVLGGGAFEYGLIQPAAGIGFVIGGFTGALFRRFSRLTVMMSTMLLEGSMLVAIGFAPTLYASLPLIAMWGLGVSIWNIFSGTVYQQMVPNHLRGRVQSVRLLIAQGAAPLGTALAGIVSEALGVRSTFGVMGALIVAGGLFGLLMPAMKAINTLAVEGVAAKEA